MAYGENDDGDGRRCNGKNRAQGDCRRSFGEKCSHLAKKQRAKFYILRRCIAMLVCWRERNDH